MEKILVAINGREEAWEALSHACSLAGRIHAQLSLLLVQTPEPALPPYEIEETGEFRKRLALKIEAAKAEGIAINFFITEGNYEDEVIGFINANRISLFIFETRGSNGARDRKKRAADKEPAAVLGRLRHKIPCRMEVVVPKNH
jgi:nucleotide-binding universal stress UspA family protein